MSDFEIQSTAFAGLKAIRRVVKSDARGFLSRLFCAEQLSQAGWSKPVAQLNHTVTARRGTIRGLHCQTSPYAEAKLVSCVQGAIWDVALDVRKDSPTFGQYHIQELSAENHTALLIPEGFAHGYQTLTPDVHLIYCHSVPYAPGAQAGFNPFDPRLAIPWPVDVTEVSAQDRALPPMTPDFQGLVP